MNDTSLVLFIDLNRDERIDLRVAAKAAIAWADMVETIGLHYDPTTPPTIDLVASEEGSQKIKAIISSVSEDPKASIRAAVISGMIFIAGTVATWSLEQVLEYLSGPDAPEKVTSFSQDEINQLAQEVLRGLEAGVANKPATRVFDELTSDPAVTGVGITNSTDARPQFVISREEFPAQVHIVEETGLERRTRVEVVDLLLFRPVLTAENNKRWGFTWPHGKMGATIKDQDFLDRLASGQLGIGMSQGIVFNVELEITEERQDAVWEVKEYAVQKVLQITPPQVQQGMQLE